MRMSKEQRNGVLGGALMAFEFAERKRMQHESAENILHYWLAKMDERDMSVYVSETDKIINRLENSALGRKLQIVADRLFERLNRIKG